VLQNCIFRTVTHTHFKPKLFRGTYASLKAMVVVEVVVEIEIVLVGFILEFRIF
jgi:hypothetical protein